MFAGRSGGRTGCRAGFAWVMNPCSSFSTCFFLFFLLLFLGLGIVFGCPLHWVDKVGATQDLGNLDELDDSDELGGPDSDELVGLWCAGWCCVQVDFLLRGGVHNINSSAGTYLFAVGFTGSRFLSNMVESSLEKVVFPRLFKCNPSNLKCSNEKENSRVQSTKVQLKNSLVKQCNFKLK